MFGKYFAVVSYAKLLRPHRAKIAGLVLSKLLVSTIALITPLVFRVLIDRVVPTKDWSLFFQVATIMAILLPLSLAVALNVSLMSTKIEQLVSFDCRRALQRKFARLPVGHFLKNGGGAHIYRMTTDTDNVTNTLTSVVPAIVVVAFEFTVFLIISLRLSATLTVLFISSVPVIVLVELLHSKNTRPLQNDIQRSSSVINDVVERFFNFAMTAKVFQRELLHTRQFLHQQALRTRQVMRKWRVDTGYQTANWLVTTGWSWFIVLYGFIMVTRGQISVGTLVALRLYLALLMRPIETSSSFIPALVLGSVSAERLTEVMNESEEITAAPDAAKALLNSDRQPAHLRMQSLSFRYDTTHPVLNSLHGEFGPGGITGITGPSGSGKTTLICLAARLFEPDVGTMFLDGYDVRALTIHELRNQLSIVQSQPMIFPGTIAENIRYGNKRATLSQVRDASRSADADKFIMSLTKGYDTVVGPEGIALSSGQVQRLALARAFARQSRLLFIDEGFTCIESSSINHVFSRLRDLSTNTTIIVISHSQNVLALCDSVATLRNGTLSFLGPTSSENIESSAALYNQSALSQR
jgi:ABC-type multidrug transport system fused ATPase/permease subunit